MAAWYNGIDTHTFDIIQYGNSASDMLRAFWLSILQSCQGCTVYFHNWSGYDAILSLKSIISLSQRGYTFKPIIQKGALISLTIHLGKRLCLTIKDSIKLLPGALGKLAKSFNVETQKDHFPHYFNPLELYGKLDWTGPLPEYKYFEPKRTNSSDYQEMVDIFKDKPWNFLEVSRQYIKGDIIALHQILLTYFKGLNETFPINPIRNLSVPGIAFTTWKTVQLPKLIEQEGHKVYDLSRTSGNMFRDAYQGGIVDVYKPHLQGQGYYYDINSLYPTAMCRSMPVGIPKLVNLTVTEFLEGSLFGYLNATVKAPDTEYIGLLPIRLDGRLVCPGGSFTGMFFSEELRFALSNGYELINIGNAYSFERGLNTFRDLITTLNDMKIQAQLDNKPALRNIAKLLMNSMYGRFGMHTPAVKDVIVTPEESLKISRLYKVLETIVLDTQVLLSYSLDAAISGDPKAIGFKAALRELPGQTNVPIAAAVTAYSRMIINEFKLLAMKLGLTIYYSDTDSMIVDGPLPEEYIDSTQLGLLKLEHIIKEGIFVAPKMYYLDTNEGGIVTKCKGYSGKLTRDDYQTLLLGEVLNLTVTKWSRSLKEGTVRIVRGLPYHLKADLNKRVKVLDNGKWVDTMPITL